jgi:hypothetical protein
VIGVTDPDTGQAVRDGDPLLDVAVDPNVRDTAHPNGGNLYAVWADGRFSNFAHDDIAFSMSTDGGLTWSDPIKVSQSTGATDADKQAFTPSVAVNSDGTVAVTYYDFRNNTATDVGASTDYWLVHASGNFTSPDSWATDEKRLTDASFNIENAAPTTRGFFLGDYEGLSAAGNSFYTLFAQAGATTSNPSDIWFRDPPPAPGGAAGMASGIDVGAPVSSEAAGLARLPIGATGAEVGGTVAAEAARFAAGSAASRETVTASYGTDRIAADDVGTGQLASPSDALAGEEVHALREASGTASRAIATSRVHDAAFAAFADDLALDTGADTDPG